MMLLTTTLGENAVSKESAETLGSVTGIVLDAPSRKITALQVGKGRKAKVVSWDAVSGVGSAAVVVEDDDALRDPNEREQRFVGGDVAVIGGLVLSDLGNAHGTVVDVEYDENSGAITSIRTESAVIESERLRSVGSYAWVVAAADDERTSLSPA
jgi:uncharacterized protein YrrD